MSIQIHLNVGGELRNPIGSKLLLDDSISVGFGEAYASKNGEVVLDGEASLEQVTVQQAEDLARQEPDAEWLVVMNAPLWDATWKRTGENEWTCIKAGMGFA